MSSKRYIRQTTVASKKYRKEWNLLSFIASFYSVLDFQLLSDVNWVGTERARILDVRTIMEEWLTGWLGSWVAGYSSKAERAHTGTPDMQLC
jgi:hypothetical protein